MNVSFQKLFYVLGSIIALFAILILGKSILIPLSFALLISFILFPLTKRFELLGMNKSLSALLSILTVMVIIGGGIYIFSTKMIDLAKDFSHIQDKIVQAFADVTIYVNQNVNIVSNLGKNELFNKIKDWLTQSTGVLVSKTFTTTATFLTGLLGTIIFTFLILIYRDGLINALASISPKDKRERVVNMFRSVQQVGKKYLGGMILLIVIIGMANSIGLWIIGIDNPFLFGYLGATLSIIPYVGATVGAIIPMVYAFVTYDSLLPLFGIAILFWFVQLITDNFLSPKIVGGSLNINALAAILSLIVGALVWGIAGMILFLPMTAMLKVFCEEFEELKPFALLIGSQNDKENVSTRKFIEKMQQKLKRKTVKKPVVTKLADKEDLTEK